jgi:hypothetical protein
MGILDVFGMTLNADANERPNGQFHPSLSPGVWLDRVYLRPPIRELKSNAPNNGGSAMTTPSAPPSLAA